MCILESTLVKAFVSNLMIIRYEIAKPHPWLVIVIVCCFQWNWILGIKKAISVNLKDYEVTYGQVRHTASVKYQSLDHFCPPDFVRIFCHPVACGCHRSCYKTLQIVGAQWVSIWCFAVRAERH